MTVRSAARSRTTRKSSRSGTASATWLRGQRPGFRLRALFQLRASGRGPDRRTHRRGLEFSARLGAGPAARPPRTAFPSDAMAMRDTDRDLTSVDSRPRRIRRRSAGRPERRHDRHRRDRLAASDADPAVVAALQRGSTEGRRHRPRFDVGVGLHGDHIGGERDAARALLAGDVDAACVIDANVLLFARDGTLSGRCRHGSSAAPTRTTTAR